MDFLAILNQCCTSGTNLLVAPVAFIVALYYFDISLSNTCFLVPNHAVFIYITTFWYTCNIWASFLLRIGLEKNVVCIGVVHNYDVPHNID